MGEEVMREASEEEEDILHRSTILSKKSHDMLDHQWGIREMLQVQVLGGDPIATLPWGILVTARRRQRRRMINVIL